MFNVSRVDRQNIIDSYTCMCLNCLYTTPSSNSNIAIDVYESRDITINLLTSKIIIYLKLHCLYIVWIAFTDKNDFTK